jgi:hypothetical protein
MNTLTIDSQLRIEDVEVDSSTLFESAKSFQKWAAERKKKGLATRWS